ncbi:YggS family pyridoxal phosphate-dependent enzyme [Pseudoduganella violaceinigra]|uniref:YggS family pyridoxal phosphate-dependent enzyme n=1 Tax=Pseudoduganella violaceinigra TaxID=246602 RepID=UPI000418CEAF|nr:YggS family pyridoxal phosphate-dependent enzyme [Pseudoduganella violaceinigra]
MSTIAHNLQVVTEAITVAAREAQRAPNEVQLLAVSKTFPAQAVFEAVLAGQRAFGENYVQEGVDKIHELANMRGCTPLEWHFIGPIQSNKTRLIAENFDWVHTIEREKIAQRLNEQRPAGLHPMQVCIQVNTSGEASKSGVLPADAAALARAVAGLPRLALRGLMSIPEPEPDFERQCAAFRVLGELREQLRGEGLALDTLSMGMSADMRAAIHEGATIVRVGSAIFGARDYNKG